MLPIAPFVPLLTLYLTNNYLKCANFNSLFFCILLDMGKEHIDEIVSQIFTIFDKDGNGHLDFVEFLCAADMTSHGTLEEKLRWNFKAYDKDGSGTLEKEELVFFMALVFQSKVCYILQAYSDGTWLLFCITGL